MTKSQIDKLGERLKKGSISNQDLEMLEVYRRSFTAAYESIAAKIHAIIGTEPSARPLKSTTSIVDKLRRERTRLSTMQDIAGCRITVPDIPAQNDLIKAICGGLKTEDVSISIVDRREKPSHGYRAVHIIVRLIDRQVEIQIRTELQHQWAEMCEALADRFGTELKYGGEVGRLRYTLNAISIAIADLEYAIVMVSEFGVSHRAPQFGDALLDAMKDLIIKVRNLG